MPKSAKAMRAPWISRHACGASCVLPALEPTEAAAAHQAEYLDHREEKLAQIARVLFQRARCCRTNPWLRMRGSAARWLLGSTALRRRRASTTWPFLSCCHRRPRTGTWSRPLHCLGGLCSVRPPREIADGEDGGGRTRGHTRRRSTPTWIGESKMEFSGYHQLQRCRQHVILGRARANTVDFAKLAAAQLVPVVHVPVDEKRTTYESFKKGGFWLVRNRDDLGRPWKT